MIRKEIVYVMGVSGCGKSSVSEQLSDLISASYEDADDYHPPENIEKMRSGIPLTDDDRMPWLAALNQLAVRRVSQGKRTVIACSCLKPSYREILQESIKDKVVFAYLKGDFDTIRFRLKHRDNHYFSGDAMLKSQFDALTEPSPQEPIDYIETDINSLGIEEVAISVKRSLEARYSP